MTKEIKNDFAASIVVFLVAFFYVLVLGVPLFSEIIAAASALGVSDLTASLAVITSSAIAMSVLQKALGHITSIAAWKKRQKEYYLLLTP